MIRVLLVDDHKPLRAGTRALLTEASDIAIIAETASGREAVDLSRQLQPDVVLLDINLPDMTGIDVARTLRDDLPEIKVVILTAYNYEQYVRALFAIGVHGYLLKSDPGLELIAAVRTVLQGKQALSVEIAAQLTVNTVRSGITGTLSAREREVLTLVSQGMGNKEIAQKLAIQRSTVDTYISSIFAKLNVHSRSEAFHAAIKRGIIVVPDM